MSKKEFSKKIAGKTVKVLTQSHKVLSGEGWGAQGLCPWCGKTLRTTAANTPKQAADNYFAYVRVHWNRDHKK